MVMEWSQTTEKPHSGTNAVEMQSSPSTPERNRPSQLAANSTVGSNGFSPSSVGGQQQPGSPHGGSSEAQVLPMENCSGGWQSAQSTPSLQTPVVGSQHAPNASGPVHPHMLAMSWAVSPVVKSLPVLPGV